MTSRTPPKPGIRLPLSLTSASRFMRHSSRSPELADHRR
jgi:hypothetical protein